MVLFHVIVNGVPKKRTRKLTSNDAHNQWMRNGRFDVQRLFVQCFQLFVILLHGVHLNFERINFQQLCPLFQIIFAIIGLIALRKIIKSKFHSQYKLPSCHLQCLPGTIDATVWGFFAICQSHCDRSTASRAWCWFWTRDDHFWHLSVLRVWFRRSFAAIPSKRSRKIHKNRSYC